MTANLISQKLRVFIGSDNQGWSLSVASFVAGYSSLDESGLIKISGTLEIQRDLLNPESIDPRANPSRWRPGQPVRVQIRNSAGTWVSHPLGYLHLLEEPDPPAEGGISLSVGCWLSWVDTFEFDDDQSGVELGAAENCAAVATRLLVANEIPAENIDLGSWEYDLASPASKVSGGSFVGQAGELAYSNNWRYLYQDASGIIRSASLNTLAGIPVYTVTLGSNDVLFSPLRDPQAPVELVKVAGVGSELGERQNGNSDVTVATGPASDVSPVCSGTATLLRETVTENWDIPEDTSQDIVFTTTTTLEELRGAVWVDVSSSPCSLVAWKRTREIRRWPQSGADALRLKSIVTEVEQREGTLLASGTPLNWRTVSDSTTSYSYGTNEAISRIETIERVAEITVDKALSDFPFQLRIARKEILEWAELAPQLWQRKERIETARIIEDSAVDKFNGNPWARRTRSRSPVSSTGDTQPPRTELWTGLATQTEKHYEGTATWEHPGGGTGRTRKRLYTVPFGFSDQQCATLAGLHRDLLVGRHYGYELELAITDELLAAGPLFQVNVVDPDGITYRLLADGVSWAHTADRASVYCVGILLDSYVGLEPVYARSGITVPAAEFGAAVDVAFEAEHGVTVPAVEFGAAVEVAFEVTHGVTVPAAQFGAVADVRVDVAHGVTVPAAEFGANVQGPVEVSHGVTVPEAQFGAAISQPWTPEQIPTVVWLDADDAATITTATGVSQWADKSGNNRHFSQSTAASQPTLTTSALNGRSVITFDGINDYLDASFSQAYTAQSVLAVFSYANASNGSDRVFTQSDEGLDYLTSGHYIPLLRNSINQEICSYAGDGFRSTLAFSYDTYGIAVSIHSGSTLTNWLNGTNGSAFPHTLSKTFTRHRLGWSLSDLVDAPYLAGGIAEVIILSSAATTETRQKAEGYLAHKWGLTASLPVGHPYKSVAP